MDRCMCGQEGLRGGFMAGHKHQIKWVEGERAAAALPQRKSAMDIHPHCIKDNMKISKLG